MKTPSELISRPPNAYDTPIKSRGLTSETIRRFQYFPTTIKNEVVHVAPYFDEKGEEVAQKVRKVADKDFFVIATTSAQLANLPLFGRSVWGDSHHKRVQGSGFRSRVVIVEGEIDAMTIAQVTRFYVPVVSINSGAQSARKSVASSIEWLEKFDEVILAFDNDEPGRAAMEECAPLFTAGKVKIIKWPNAKDANELLTVANRPGDIQLSIDSASLWAPPGTHTGSGLHEILRVADSEKAHPPLTFPWPGMNKALNGALRQNDAIVFLAGSGVGKSTMLFESMAHWMDEGHKIAAIFLEDTPVGVLDGILTVATGERLRVDPKKVPLKKKIEALDARGWSDRLFLEDPEKIAKTKDALYSKVRYLVGAHDVSIVIVDPLSFLVSKAVTDQDERRAIDHMMTELSDLARALSVTLVMSHHLSRPEGTQSHEEGAKVSLKHARGSHGIAMFAANILAIEAPDKSEGEIAAKIVVKKSRWRGELRDQIVSHLFFNPNTGRLVEVTPSTSQRTLDASIEDDIPDHDPITRELGNI